jgi:hypothetical protein
MISFSKIGLAKNILRVVSTKSRRYQKKNAPKRPNTH